MTDWKNLSYLDTLAAAYARAGDFAQAVEWEQRATASQDAAKQTRLERLGVTAVRWTVNGLRDQSALAVWS